MRAHELGMKLVVGGCLALSVGACGGSPGRSPSAGARAVVEPQWQDALGARPRVLLTLRPKVLLKDPVYGPLFRWALELARQQSHAVASTRLLEAGRQAGEGITEALRHAWQASRPGVPGA